MVEVVLRIKENEETRLRQLLLQTERKLEQGEPGFSPTLILGGASAEVLNQHIRLLSDEGFVEATLKPFGVSQPHITGLTRQAHEFLAVARDEAR